MEKENEIKQIRVELGKILGRKITQERLANMVGLTSRTIFTYEKYSNAPEYFTQYLRYLLDELQK